VRLLVKGNFTIVLLNKTGNARPAERLLTYHRGIRFLFFIDNEGNYRQRWLHRAHRSSSIFLM